MAEKRQRILELEEKLRTIEMERKLLEKTRLVSIKNSISPLMPCVQLGASSNQSPKAGTEFRQNQLDFFYYITFESSLHFA